MLHTASKWLAVLAIIAAATGSSPSAMSQGTRVRPASLDVGAVTRTPFGWADFCRRYGTECDVPALTPVQVDLNDSVLRRITEIDRDVNAAIEPVSDMDHWGVLDQWDYPTDGKGDCEDYVLLKRKRLMEAGLPRQALLITVVRDRKNEGHAVLTVKTSKGDLVLDNLTDQVVLWSDTGYSFVKRQSQANPNVWVMLGDPNPGPAFTAAR